MQMHKKTVQRLVNYIHLSPGKLAVEYDTKTLKYNLQNSLEQNATPSIFNGDYETLLRRQRMGRINQVSYELQYVRLQTTVTYNQRRLALAGEATLFTAWGFECFYLAIHFQKGACLFSENNCFLKNSCFCRTVFSFRVVPKCYECDRTIFSKKGKNKYF